MPKLHFDSKAESTQFELLPDGEYAFEVVAVDVGISTGSKTAGADIIELKCKFFKDATFARPVGQWTEKLIFHPSCAWKVSVFTKCANMLINGKVPADGEEIDYSDETMIGLRGWCQVGNHKTKGAEPKTYNDVKVWLTNKEKLPRNMPAPKVDPFAEKKTDDNPENW